MKTIKNNWKVALIVAVGRNPIVESAKVGMMVSDVRTVPIMIPASIHMIIPGSSVKQITI